jgi:hypothetical protein
LYEQTDAHSLGFPRPEVPVRRKAP